MKSNGIFLLHQIGEEVQSLGHGDSRMPCTFPADAASSGFQSVKFGMFRPTKFQRTAASPESGFNDKIKSINYL